MFGYEINSDGAAKSLSVFLQHRHNAVRFKRSKDSRWDSSLRQNKIEVEEDTNPLIFWRDNQHKLSFLSKIVKMIFATPISFYPISTFTTRRVDWVKSRVTLKQIVLKLSLIVYAINYARILLFSGYGLNIWAHTPLN